MNIIFHLIFHHLLLILTHNASKHIVIKNKRIPLKLILSLLQLGQLGWSYRKMGMPTRIFSIFALFDLLKAYRKSAN